MVSSDKRILNFADGLSEFKCRYDDARHILRAGENCCSYAPDCGTNGSAASRIKLIPERCSNGTVHKLSSSGYCSEAADEATDRRAAEPLSKVSSRVREFFIDQGRNRGSGRSRYRSGFTTSTRGNRRQAADGRVSGDVGRKVRNVPGVSWLNVTIWKLVKVPTS